MHIEDPSWHGADAAFLYKTEDDVCRAVTGDGQKAACQCADAGAAAYLSVAAGVSPEDEAAGAACSHIAADAAPHTAADGVRAVGQGRYADGVEIQVGHVDTALDAELYAAAVRCVGMDAGLQYERLDVASEAELAGTAAVAELAGAACQ